jgi:hypothetical protein
MRILLILLLIFQIIICKENTDFKAEELSNNSEKSYLTDRDTWGIGDENFQGGRFSFLDLKKMTEIKLRETTEGEIYKLFGKEIKIRLTYSKEPLARKHNGKYIPIDKLILYFDAKGTVTELPNAKKYETFERLSVGFYLYRDKLQFYSINHEDVEARKLLETSTKDVVESEKIHFGWLWPNQSCDRNFYDFTVLKLAKEKWYSRSIDCEWEKDNFKKVLRKDGYFKLLEE